MFATIKFHYAQQEQLLTIDARQGNFPGMLNERYFIVHYNTKEKSSSPDDNKTHGALITYNGKKQVIRLWRNTGFDRDILLYKVGISI